MEGQKKPRRAWNTLAVEPLEDRVLFSLATLASLPATLSMLREAATSTLTAARVESIPVVYREILREMQPTADSLERPRSAGGENTGHTEPHELALVERFEHLVLALTKFSQEEATVTSLAFDRSVESQSGSGPAVSIRTATAQPDIPILPPPSLLSAAPAVDQVWMRSHSPMGQVEPLDPAITYELTPLFEGVSIDADQSATGQIDAQSMASTETSGGVAEPSAVIPLQHDVGFHLLEWQRTVADFLSRLAALGDPRSTPGISIWLMAFATVLAGAALEGARRQTHSSQRSLLPSPSGWRPEAFLPDES